MRSGVMVTVSALVLAHGTTVAAQQRAAVVAQATSLHVDATSLQPMTLVYDVVIEGSRVAENTIVVIRADVGGRDVVRVNGTTAGVTSGTSELTFDAKSFVPIAMNMELQIGQQTMGMSLSCSADRITGVMRTPEGDKPVDAPLRAGTLLGGMDLFALMLTDFAHTKEITFPLFDAHAGSVSSVTAKVMGESRVTVPAGAFDVYDLAVTGVDGIRAIAVTRTAPHVIVRQELTAHAVVMELKSVR